jgi:hypothetical protein
MPARNPALANLIGTEPVQLTIGGRTFIQEELGIEQAATLTESAVRIVNQAIEAGTINIKEVEGIDPNDTSTIWPVLMKAMKLLPEAVGELFATLLLTEQGELLETEDRLFVRRHLKIRQAMGMISTFVQQNDIPGVVQSFFSTRDAVVQGVQEIATNGSKASPAPSSEPLATTE